jgi:catechol 2,3-dioxygenase-like lactoylglutathione lyase family enzyme
MSRFPVQRAGAILAVADVARSIEFYTGRLGFEVEAVYEDPAYATLTLGGMRLSLAEQGHPAPDRPGVSLIAPEDRSRLQVALVIEVADARTVHAGLVGAGVPSLAEPYEPPWGGSRFFVADPDGYLVEIEQPA